MERIGVEDHDGVFVVSLAGGVTNPINLETVEELTTALSNAQQEGARGLVLTAQSDKFFSIGFDLPRLLDLGRDGVSGFYSAFNEMALRLYTMPIPTITAVTGHAVAGGFILAAMTDFRFWADGKGKGGVNELRLGVPVPLLPTLVLAQLLGDRRAKEMIYTGEIYSQDWLREAGFIDQLVPENILKKEAEEYVRGIGAWPAKAFTASKKARTDPLKQLYFEKHEEDATRFLECWAQEGTQALLKEARKKF